MQKMITQLFIFAVSAALGSLAAARYGSLEAQADPESASP